MCVVIVPIFDKIFQINGSVRLAKLAKVPSLRWHMGWQKLSVAFGEVRQPGLALLSLTLHFIEMIRGGVCVFVFNVIFFSNTIR